MLGVRSNELVERLAIPATKLRLGQREHLEQHASKRCHLARRESEPVSRFERISRKLAALPGRGDLEHAP